MLAIFSANTNKSPNKYAETSANQTGKSDTFTETSASLDEYLGTLAAIAAN